MTDRPSQSRISSILNIFFFYITLHICIIYNLINIHGNFFLAYPVPPDISVKMNTDVALIEISD